MAAHGPDSSERRHVARARALRRSLPPAVLAFAEERDVVHVERVAVRPANMPPVWHHAERSSNAKRPGPAEARPGQFREETPKGAAPYKGEAISGQSRDLRSPVGRPGRIQLQLLHHLLSHELGTPEDLCVFRALLVQS